MRGRAIGLGLLGLGAFLLAGALATRLLLAPALVVLPLKQTAAPVAVSTDATYFNIGEQKQYTGDPVTVRQKVAGVATADGAGADVAVWAFGSTVSDSSDTLITPTTEYTVCLDRRTAAAVDCPSEKIGTDTAKHITGLTLNFPFGTKQQAYPVFDATANKAFRATFTGTTTIQGVAVDTFEQTIPETVVQTTDVPGSMAGAPDQPSVSADVVYSNQRTLYVEPTSGVIIDIKEHPDLVFRGPDGTTGVTLLKGTFSGDKQTVADGVKRAKKAQRDISLVTTKLPLLLVVLGLVAALAGVLLARRGSAAAPDAEQSEPEIGSDANRAVAVP